MKKIQLGGNRYKNKPIRGYALVDDDDYEKLTKFKWSMGGKDSPYAVRKVWIGSGKPQVLLFMHRIIAKTPKGKFTDHINGNKLDNRKSNLRVCTYQHNNRNKVKYGKFSSIYKGVSWRAKDKSWVANITINKKNHSLGSFKEERHAGMVYDLWAKELFGEYARLNFISIGENKGEV